MPLENNPLYGNSMTGKNSSAFPQNLMFSFPKIMIIIMGTASTRTCRLKDVYAEQRPELSIFMINQARTS
jgi:hypothetical protein